MRNEVSYSEVCTWGWVYLSPLKRCFHGLTPTSKVIGKGQTVYAGWCRTRPEAQ